jgi:uncharacterized protein (DUF58 family)
MSLAAIDPALIRASHQAAREAVARLRLPLRSMTWRGQTGEMAGSGVGSSMDFHDHRSYLPGDDPRQINWNVYARTGNYTMKLFREEVRPTVDVIWDVSASMWAYEEKSRRALELLYFAVESAWQQHASLRVTAISGDIFYSLTDEALQTGRWLSDVTERFADTEAESPNLSRLALRRQSLRVWISDLLFPGRPEKWLHPFLVGSGRGVIFAPVAQEESNPAWDGNYEFIDAESRRSEGMRIESIQLQAYRTAYERHFQLWAQSTRERGAALSLINSTGSLTEALSARALTQQSVELCQ